MPPEENDPQEKVSEEESENTEVFPGDESPEKIETKPKKRKTASKRKKAETIEADIIEEAPIGVITYFREKFAEEEAAEVGPPEEDLTSTSDEDNIISPPVVTETQPEPPSTTDPLVEKAVKFINETANKTVYKGSVQIGAYVLKHFYGDDYEAATSRDPHKPQSYRKLCNHPELMVKSEALGLMVRVAAQEKFFAAQKVETEGLTYSHKAELIRLPNNSQKIQAVKKVLRDHLSVRKLADYIDQLPKMPVLQGPLPIGNLEKVVRSPEKLFDDPRRKGLFHDDEKRKEHLKKLQGKTRRKLLEQVDEAVHKAKEWVELYEALRRDLEEIEEEKRHK